MRTIFFKAEPYHKDQVTSALEAGVDGLIVPADHVEKAARLARCLVISDNDLLEYALEDKADEIAAAEELKSGGLILLREGWQVIPVENLLAVEQNTKKHLLAGSTGISGLALEVSNLEQANLAAGILEKGSRIVVVSPKGIGEIRAIVAALRHERQHYQLDCAEITKIYPVGMGHRVCVDTLSLLRTGQGSLTGNSANFTFLVHAETERNEYVASRPFRINAGAVHAYVMGPHDRTAYLEELRAGHEILVLDWQGNSDLATVGRVKIERRPMLFIEAKINEVCGSIFLQNAETIRLVTPAGVPVSVVSLQVGDQILCHLDTAGRHFGMRVNEEIDEV